MTHYQGVAHGTMKLTLEKRIYDCSETLPGWEMCCLSTTLKSHFSCIFQPLNSEVPKRLGPYDSILLHSSSLAKEAKVVIISHTLGETEVDHIQVNFLKVKTFFFLICALFLTYGERAFQGKLTMSLYISLSDKFSM